MGAPHKATEDVRIGEFIIPKGCTVSGSLYHAMRDPKWFTNPEVFNPSRFLDSGISLIYFGSYKYKAGVVIKEIRGFQNLTSLSFYTQLNKLLVFINLREINGQTETLHDYQVY